MAYQIDFTESIWSGRKFRKWLLRLFLLAMLAGTAWGVYDVYTTYNEPTLNMRLAEYEAVARPVEEMNIAWDAAAKEYDALVRYYRLVWAANPTNFLTAMAAPTAPRLSRGFRPLGWTLTTGGECRLDYRFVFDAGDKAAQSKGLEEELARVVTSVVQVVEGKVDVQGVQHENLLDVDALNVVTKFSLPNVKSFPNKEKTLASCVSEIAAMRKKVHESKFADKADAKGVQPTAQAIMMAYLPSQFAKEKETGKPNPDFPELANVLNVAGWFARADKFIAQYKIPGDDRERVRLKATWKEVGEARFPWDRFRVLDNEALVARTKVLGTVSDGVKRFKGFLDKRSVDNRKKLEPFVDAYEHNDVFNKPLVESDLKDRVAAAAGIVRAKVVFKDEEKVEPAVLVKDDEKFSFTWVRWTLTLGAAMGRDGEREQPQGEQGAEESLPLGKLADCACRAVTLGPGYALDKVKVSFDETGCVSGAILEGLLPVKKVESLKEAVK